MGTDADEGERGERERGPFIVMLILRRGQTWVGRDRQSDQSENVGGVCLERANYSYYDTRSEGDALAR